MEIILLRHPGWTFEVIGIIFGGFALLVFALFLLEKKRERRKAKSEAASNNTDYEL